MGQISESMGGGRETNGGYDLKMRGGESKPQDAIVYLIMLILY